MTIKPKAILIPRSFTQPILEMNTYFRKVDFTKLFKNIRNLKGHFLEVRQTVKATKLYWQEKLSFLVLFSP